MMKTTPIYFDVYEILFTDKAREITLLISGEYVKLCEVKFEGTDLWIVPSAELESVLQKRFLAFYPMFFGMLLTTINEYKTKTPIRGVCLDDVARAFEKNNLQGLVDCIVAGTYQSEFAKSQ